VFRGSEINVPLNSLSRAHRKECEMTDSQTPVQDIDVDVGEVSPGVVTRRRFTIGALAASAMAGFSILLPPLSKPTPVQGSHDCFCGGCCCVGQIGHWQLCTCCIFGCSYSSCYCVRHTYCYPLPECAGQEQLGVYCYYQCSAACSEVCGTCSPPCPSYSFTHLCPNLQCGCNS
jgi:hypothetical protein